MNNALFGFTVAVWILAITMTVMKRYNWRIIRTGVNSLHLQDGWIPISHFSRCQWVCKTCKLQGSIDKPKGSDEMVDVWLAMERLWSSEMVVLDAHAKKLQASQGGAVNICDYASVASIAIDTRDSKHWRVVLAHVQ